MNVHRLFRGWISSLLIGGALALLTSCQMLTGLSQSGNNGSVTVSNGSLDFGTVAIGNSKTIQDTLTNSTASSVTIRAVGGLTADFQVTGVTLPLVVGAGQQSSFSVQFQPGAKGKPTVAISLVGDNSQTLATLSATGNAVAMGQLLPNPSSVSFGNLKVGKNQTTNVTLSNSGGTDLTVNQATLSGAGFSMGNLTLPLTLKAGQTTTVGVTFAPPNSGNFTGSVSFKTTAAQSAAKHGKDHAAAAQADDTVMLPLSGAGVAAGTLSPSPVSLAFGNVQASRSASLPETVTNTGASTVTITQANVTGAGLSVSGLTLPATLATNQSATFTVTFAPAAAGAVSGNLALVSDASNTPLNIALTGTGVTAGTLAANPTSLAFGNITTGNTSNKSETVTNTGGTAVTISAANVTGAGLSVSGVTLPVTLTTNQTATFTVTFAPTTAGAVNGTLALVSNASNSPLNIALTGTGVTAGTLAANPTSLSFGNITTGNTSNKSETVTNTGGTAVTISAANVTGAGFSVSGVTLPVTLATNQAATFTVTFAPATAGAVNGTLALVSNASNSPLNIALSGTGVTPGLLVANPASLPFGNVQVGNTSNKSETVTNTGGTAVTISAANVTGVGFSVSGVTLPVTLTTNQTATFTVTFAPTANGAVSGTLALVSNASNTPLNIALSGTGFTPGALTSNPTSVAFGNVVLGNNSSVPVTLTNTASTSVTISGASATGSGFSITGLSLPLTLGGSASTTFNVVFTPPAAGASSGTLTINSNASNPTLSVALSGTGVTQGQITPNPTSLTFGNVVVGGSKSLTETLTNSGGTSLTISAAAATGTGFSMSGLTLPLTLTAGQSSTFTVRFAPTTAGNATGNVSITSNGANPNLNIATSGTGVTPGTLAANPTSLPFGNVTVGQNASLSETVTNTGGASVTISAANVSGPGFSVSGVSLPVTLATNQTATFTVKFAPTVAGAASGTLAVVSDASNSPLNVALSGTGITPGTLAANPTSLAFGSVTTGNTSNKSETVTNTGGTAVTISAANVTGAGFSVSGVTLPVTLTTNQSATFTVTFAPTVAGAVSGTLAVVSDASNSPLNIALTGTGVTPGTLTANPTSLPFGNVQVGNTSNLSETVTNTGGTTVRISATNVTGAGFSVSGPTLPVTLNANQSATFTATFAPTSAGAASGTLAVVSDASNSPLNIALSGTGAAPGQLSVSPATLSFGNVVVGANSSQSGSLSAASASVTVSSASSSSGEFVLSGITFPKTIAAGQSAPFTVTFTPTSPGTANANLTFASNATNGPTVQALTGNGTAPPPHRVDLNWNASASSGVVGYNIYRRLPSGQYVKGSPINSTLDSGLAYTDNNVTAAQTYFYAVTAVDGSSIESDFSTEVQAIIPTP